VLEADRGARMPAMPTTVSATSMLKDKPPAPDDSDDDEPPTPPPALADGDRTQRKPIPQKREGTKGE
jgi:hypothetical protein